MREQGGLLLAAPESRFSGAASAAADLHLQVTGIFGIPPSVAADNDGAYGSGSSASPPPFLHYAPHPLPPSPPRTHILLDCGISFNDAAAGPVAPHMPIMMVHALTKVLPSAVLLRWFD